MSGKRELRGTRSRTVELKPASAKDGLPKTKRQKTNHTVRSENTDEKQTTKSSEKLKKEENILEEQDTNRKSSGRKTSKKTNKPKSCDLSEYSYTVKKNTKPESSEETRTKSQETTCAKEQNNKVMEVEEQDTFLRDLMMHGFRKSSSVARIKPCGPIAQSSQNLMHALQHLSFGLKSRVQIQCASQSSVVNVIKDFELFRTASPFDRRVTALEWHPTKPNILAVGSKGGDIILWDTESANKDKFIQGIGAAGSCQAMKFWPWDTDKVVRASINGTVTLHDFELEQGTVLADTMNSYDHWYCSLDVNPSRYLVAAGRNAGILHLMSTEGRKVFEYRLHKNKITHVEFSPREEWLLCTASTDQTVQLWDIRNMKDRKSALCVLNHEKPVNSAYFSSTDGCRLLTTDQNKEIRVYRAPCWQLETKVEHPHRFFQHITPFKATWHPLQDLIVCGRYPDKTFPGSTGSEPRTIDIFDAETGNQITQVYSHGSDGLCPLNKFNKQGDVLASGMGFHILLWNRKEVIARKQAALISEMSLVMESWLGRNLVSDPGHNQRSRPRPRPSKKKKTDEDTDELKKLKTKTKENVKTENNKNKKSDRKDK